MRRLAILLALLPCEPAGAQTPALADRVRAILATPDLAGTRWGILVINDAGREVVAIDPDARFVPASNSKLPAVLADMAAPAPVEGTGVALEGDDVVLVGAGDPWLSSAADCARDCLATLADAVAARTRRVRDVIGDDRRWVDERWGQGWSWNNLPTRSGAAISALSLDENVVALTVKPDGGVAEPSGWYRIEDRVEPGAATSLSIERLPRERTVVVRGTIAGAAPVTLAQPVDDPAAYAAHRFAGLLRARGVKVVGEVKARHRRPGEPPAALPLPIARLTPPPLAETYARTLKASQNLFAEMSLRRGSAEGTAASGLARYLALFDAAGAARTGWDFADGSGMSTYNRLSPRASVALLRWAAGQPFAATFRASLPIAGVDGTLAARFKGTALEGRLFAKTGSLNGASALSGYLTARSGRTLTFAIFANDMPGGAPPVTPAMDRALIEIAEAN
ncbi:D-alanyl-D-alanine carboxypeptidase/D-alanyl-D-alanine-endopeptidase [Sphingomonas spermidinifaciens]|uniref:D-alanyl-D-alanine carboxypeptidase/D-alanyl-D-alanine-endopeptidase n=1 Tax=Sphingomonas spermidinifaciens TaxID=1141889 RepID=A0A2A4B2I9_9SPHN|nr:D-alanyl-D-alanine carboxypeptidase/D-alanyl-D-alanine-endopeptidase [Sphingomonas spermidinifaciens]PCD02277.1 D-alanyl-D-alanine carboxypeptidase/D-alanyl-D-alanine-endopeptidase [Sphingomonas spermidinifaciens]